MCTKYRPTATNMATVRHVKIVSNKFTIQTVCRSRHEYNKSHRDLDWKLFSV
jgi:hypothetical protein